MTVLFFLFNATDSSFNATDSSFNVSPKGRFSDILVWRLLRYYRTKWLNIMSKINNTPKSATGGNAQGATLVPGSSVLTDLRTSIELKPSVKARLVKTFWPYAPAELLVAMMDGLRGFQPVVQHRMIDALRDYFFYDSQHRTLIAHVDQVLVGLYAQIDEFNEKLEEE